MVSAMFIRALLFMGAVTVSHLFVITVEHVPHIRLSFQYTEQQPQLLLAELMDVKSNDKIDAHYNTNDFFISRNCSGRGTIRL